VLDGNKITLRFPSDETASEAYEYLSSLSESAVEPKAVNPHSENTLDGEDTGEYTTEYAIDIAQLWRAGKLIGADKDQIIFALLRGLERKSITTEETSFEQGLKEFEDVTGPISSPPPTVGRMNGPIERMSPPDESFFDETRDCQCAAYCMQARGMKSDPPMNCRGLPALNTGESQ
jgi:hypothetical protein